MDHGPLWPGFQVYLLKPLVAIDGIVTFFASPCILSIQGLISRPSSVSHLTLHNTGCSSYWSPFLLFTALLLKFDQQNKTFSALLSLCPSGMQCVSKDNRHCSKLLANCCVFPEPRPYLKEPTHHNKEAIWVGSFTHYAAHLPGVSYCIVTITMEYWTQVPALKLIIPQWYRRNNLRWWRVLRWK